MEDNDDDALGDGEIDDASVDDDDGGENSNSSSPKDGDQPIDAEEVAVRLTAAPRLREVKGGKDAYSSAVTSTLQLPLITMEGDDAVGYLAPVVERATFGWNVCILCMYIPRNMHSLSGG